MLAIALVAGMLMTILVLQDFSAAQKLELVLGLAVLVQFGHYLVDRLLEWARNREVAGARG